MRILITGATGYVGRNLMKSLEDMNEYELSITTRNCEDAKLLFYKIANLEIIDLSSGKYKTRIKEFNPEVVIHLAAIYPGTNRNEKAISDLIDTNISFGINLLDALEGTDLKYFINTGTHSEYQFEGALSLNGASLYAASKTAFRSFISFYQKLYGFCCINVLPYNIYGTDVRGKLMNYIMEAFGSPQPIGMTLGEQKIDFIHIDDVCNFYKSLLYNLEKINSKYTEYHLGSGTATSVRDVARLMEKIYQKKANINWGALPYREGELMFSKAPEFKGEFSWSPYISIEDGIRRLLNELSKNKDFN